MPSGVSAACRSVCRHGMSRSLAPVTYRAGTLIRSQTPARSSVDAIRWPSASSPAPDFTTNVALVIGGRSAHMSPKQNGPLIPATAVTRGSNAATLGA